MLSVAGPLNHGPLILLFGNLASSFRYFVGRTHFAAAGRGGARAENQRSDPDAPLFGEHEVIIFVGMALCRLLRPFDLFIHELLAWDRIRNAMDLEGVTAAQVSCR